MNLYLVVSELIYHVAWEDWFNRLGHRQDYRIAELVVAQSHGQARWLVWRYDNPDSTFPNVEDMPKFAVRKKAEGVEGPPRVLSYEERKAIDLPEGVWDIGNAPHIGIEEEVCQTKKND